MASATGWTLGSRLCCDEVGARSEITLGQLENLMRAVPDTVADRGELIALQDGWAMLPTNWCEDCGLEVSGGVRRCGSSYRV